MNILLTGATGFLGSFLANAFVAAGNRVAVLKRQHSDLERLNSVAASLTYYNLEQDGLSAAFADMRIDAVVHAATCYGRKGESPVEMFTANTVWPLQLLEAAVKARTPLFVNTDTSLDRSLNAYALSKKQFRDWGFLIAGEGNICFLNLLLEHFYGPGDDESKFITQVIRRCLRNEPELLLTSGLQRRDFVYIDDVVTAYLLVMNETANAAAGFREYGLGSGEAVPIRDVVTIIKGLTNSATSLNFGAIPLRKNEVMVSEADISALQSLGWQPQVSIAAGLERTIGRERTLVERKQT